MSVGDEGDYNINIGRPVKKQRGADSLTWVVVQILCVRSKKFPKGNDGNSKSLEF